MPHEDMITRHYQLLLQLVKGQLKASDNLQATEAFADGLIEQFSQQTGLFKAQLFIYKPQYPYLVNYLSNLCILSLSVAQQYKLTEAALKHLIRACLTSQISRLKSLNNQFQQPPAKADKLAKMQNPKRAVATLNRTGIKHKLWLKTVLEQLSYTTLKHRHRIQLTSAILSISVFISDFITPVKYRKAKTLDEIVKLLLCNKPGMFSRSLLEKLVQAITLYPVGTIARINQRKPAQVYHALILKTEAEHLLVQPVDAKSKQATGKACYANPSDVYRIYPTYSSRSTDYYNQFSEEQVEICLMSVGLKASLARVEHIDVFHPPDSLRAIQQQLNLSQPSIDRICHLIKGDDQLNNQLIEYANRLTRFDLKVTETRHAVMLLGLDNSAQHLLFAAIKEQLFKTSFPMARQLQNMVSFRCQLAYQLADVSRTLDPLRAASFAMFASSGLLLCSAVYDKVAQFKAFEVPADCHRTSAMVTGIAADVVDKTSARLARSWHQPTNLIKSLQQSDKMPLDITESKALRDLHAILGLSNCLCIAFYAQLSDSNQLDNRFIQQACKALKISQQQLVPLIHDVAAQQHTLHLLDVC